MYARKVIEKNLKNEVSLLLLYMGNFFFKNDMPTQMPVLTVDKSVSTEQNLEIDSIKKFVKNYARRYIFGSNMIEISEIFFK